MRVLHEVLLLAADTGRSRAYLDALVMSGLLPSTALILAPGHPVTAASIPSPTRLFDNKTPLAERLCSLEVPFTSLETHDVNDPGVIEVLERQPEKYVIFSGPPGALLRERIFGTGKRFLHIHPGRLPDLKGSTPMYYSLLTEGSITATALFLSLAIDEGEVIEERTYEPPADRTKIDTDFDPWIRADLLAKVLTKYADTGKFETQPQPKNSSGAYFIIHPVLKHLAILKRSN